MSEAVVGSVAVEVVPSATNFAQKLREKLLPDIDRIGTEAGRLLAERIQSAMGDIKVRIDTTAAKADIDLIREDLRRLSSDDARIRVAVDTAAARAELAALKAKLDEFGASSTTHTVRINQVGGSSSGGGGMGAGMGIGLSLLPALIPVAAAAIPVIGGIGAALLGAAAGGAVLKSAFSGIGDAVTALGAKTGQTGQQIKAQATQQLAAANGILNAQDAVANSVRALANAQTAAGQQAVQSAEQVKNAQQAATDARRSAALSVANAQQSLVGAEQSYTSSLYTEQQAQVALNQARKQAAQTLQDLSNQVKDGSLSQRQATIDLRNAMDNLKVVDFNPHSTQQQRDEAQLQVDQAKQHLSELELANSRLATQKATADKQGVSGAPAVVAAEHAVAAATDARKNAYDGVARAQAAVVEAQRAGAESIAKAEQGVTDALRQQAIQAASSQQAILSAEQGIVSSQRSLAQAYASAGAQGSAANDAVAKAMAGLTPAGVAFAHFVNDRLKPALKSITDAAQQGFLPGFQAALETLMPFMPGFAKFAGDIAKELGDMAKSAAEALRSPFWKQFGTFLGDLAKSSLPVLGQILGNLATGFAGLFQAIMPATDGMGGGLVAITKAFADWATHLGTNKGFQAFLQYIKDTAPAVGTFFKDLLVIVGKLVAALAPFGALLLAAIEKLAGFLAQLSPDQLLMIGAGILGIVAAFTGGFGLIVLAITAVIAGLVNLYLHNPKFKRFVDDLVGKIKEGAQYIKDHWREMAAALLDTWDRKIKPIFDKWVAVFTDMWKTYIKPILGYIVDHWKGIATGIKLAVGDIYLQIKVFTDIVSFLYFNIVKPVSKMIVDEWAALATAMKWTWDNVLHPTFHAFAGVFGNVKSAFSSLKDGLSTVWDDIKTMFGDGVNFITQRILNPLIDAVTKVAGAFGVKLKIDPFGKIDTSVATGANSTGMPHQGPGGRAVMAHGGVLPGYAPGVDSIHAMLSPGEGVLVPEAVRGLGADFVHAANKHFSNRQASSDGSHFAGGGVAGSVLGAINPIGNLVGHLFGGAGASAALDLAEKPIKAVIAHLAPSLVLKTLGDGAFSVIDKAIRAFMGGHPSGGSNVGPASVGSAGGAARWAPIVNQVLALLGIPGSALNGILSLINHESGGNPNAINLTDSNAMAGHPSQGLMQTIPTTFAAYAGQFASRGITDPLANIYAGTNYALHNYGVDMLAAGGRHDANGNYIGYDSGGYLQPGVTQVYNGTGKPEPVFTDDQWAKLSNANGSQQKGNGVPAVFHITDSSDPYRTAHEVLRLQQFAGTV